MTATRAEGVILGALESIAAQDYDGPIDLVVAAGDEATASAASATGASVIDNPTQTTPAGLNLALAESTGQVVVRVDAQSRIPPDYVTKALESLEETDAAAIGGMQIPIGTTFWEKATAAAMSSPLGAGDARYRVGGDPGPTDTVYLGVYRRETLDRLGGYDESFIRNQDYELNFRIRESGGVVWFDPGLLVQYRPRGSLASLARQYFDYGRWKRYFSRAHPGNLKARQLAPPGIVLGLIATFALGFLWPTAWWLGAGYFAAILGAGLFSLSQWGLPALGMPLALLTMHFSWGIGFLFGQSNDP